MPTFTTTDDILRHIQDNTFNCGRTCAQMIISALTLAPTSGADPRTIAVVPTQATLATRETDQPDPLLPADVWLTHPDEMLELLRDSPELLAVGADDWRLQAYPTGKRLVADVLHTLATSGMPAVVSIKQNDHWVVIKAAHRDDAGRLMIELLEPSDPQIMMRQHRYEDECNHDANGQAYIKYEMTRNALIGLDLRINPRPNPSGMNDYAGQCVGILYGAAPTDEALDETMAAVVDVSPKKRAAGRPTPDEFYAELAISAQAWKLERVRRFLESRPELVASRWVRGIESPDIEYAVMTMLSGHVEAGAPRQGLMAAFDADGALQQLQFTTSEKAIRSLARFAGEDLWWTTRWLPTLPSPFYPFARVHNQANQYVRLVNDTSFEYR
jgi:hypothetical protein